MILSSLLFPPQDGYILVVYTLNYVLLAFIVLYGHKNPKLFIAFYTHTLVAYSSAVVAHTFIVGS